MYKGPEEGQDLVCSRTRKATVTGVRLGVVVGEVVTGQNRQALLYRKESEFYSRYNGMSWRYKARMVDICYNVACQAPNSPSYLEFTILCNSDASMPSLSRWMTERPALFSAPSSQATGWPTRPSHIDLWFWSHWDGRTNPQPSQGWQDPTVMMSSYGNQSDSSLQAWLLMLKDNPGPVLQLWWSLAILQHLSNMSFCICMCASKKTRMSLCCLQDRTWLLR